MMLQEIEKSISNEFPNVKFAKGTFCDLVLQNEITKEYLGFGWKIANNIKDKVLDIMCMNFDYPIPSGVVNWDWWDGIKFVYSDTNFWFVNSRIIIPYLDIVESPEQVVNYLIKARVGRQEYINEIINTITDEEIKLIKSLNFRSFYIYYKRDNGGNLVLFYGKNERFFKINSSCINELKNIDSDIIDKKFMIEFEFNNEEQLIGNKSHTISD